MRSIYLLTLFFIAINSAFAQPANDDFANAIDVTGIINSCSADAAYTTLNATGDLNAGSCWNTSPNYNVWFTFDGTSTGNMKITIDRDGASKGTIRRINAAVWEADGVTQVACKRYINDNDVIVLEIVGTLVDGNQYYLSVDNDYSGYRGSFTLCLDDTDAGITYDYYEGATDINGLINSCSADGAFTTYGATSDKNAGSCWNTSPNYNVWFTFDGTSTGNMKITIDRDGASKGTIRRINAVVWEADGVTQVACKRYINDNDVIVLEIVGTLVDGDQYYLSVDNDYSGYRGSFTLCLDDTDAGITYDYYEGATDINGLINSCSADAAFTTYGATSDKNAGSCWNTSPNYNVWFTFDGTSTGNMKITIDRDGASKGTIRRINAAVWEADGVTQVACKRYINDNDVIVLEIVGTLVDGNQYYLSVDNDYSGYRGSFTLCLDDTDAGITYDYYEGAIDINGLINSCSADGAFTTYGATSDKNAGSCWNTSPNYNVWFTFDGTSTGNMKITIDRDGASKGTIRRINAAVWEADGVTQVACKRYINDNDVIVLEIVGTLVDGNQYYLSVDNDYSGYRGSFTLCLDDTDAGISYDYYEGATDINGLINSCSADGAFTTYGATSDKNAGSCWNTSPNYNVWFTFDGTSTGNMKITIDRDGASKGTIRRINAAVWEADGVTQVACKRYINDNDVIVIEIVGTLVDGNQYYLSVDNNYSGYRGSFTLCLDDTDAGISYDYYEGAIEIADIHNWCSAEGEYTTYGATPDKNAGSCWNTSPNYNVWFKFVATQPYINIEAITSTAGNTVRRLNVALWEADGVTPVSCNRYISDNDDVSVGSTTLTPTNTYYISVDNNYSGYRGSFKLCVTDDAAYNYYEGAVELTDLNNWCSADAEFTTSGADGDKSAASCWNTSPNYNRWFKFTAISPNATISVNRGSLGTIRRINLALWQSDGTTEVACNRYSSDNDDVSISVGSLVIGNDYYISVDNNYSGYRGSFMLCVSNVDQTYYSRQSGSWTDPNTWSTVGYGGTAASDYPKVGDVANIEDNTITITTNEVAAEVNISTSANNTGLTVSNGSLDVSGNFVVTNPGNNFNHAFTFNNSTIHVDNDFIINKNGGNANISIGISTLANFTIDNDFVFNSTAGTGNNTISISVLSNFTVGNNLILSNTGGPKTTLTIDNSNATITSNLNFIASADNKNEIDLVNSGNLHLKGSVDRGTPAYGILSSAAGTTVYFDSNDNLQIFPHSTGSGTGDTFTYQNVNINNTRITSPQLTLNGAVTVNGTLTLVDGQLLSTASKLLTIAAGGAITGASISSFINGPVRKIGNTDFEFPVGDDNFWQPISITNLTGDAATEFTAEYFVQTPPDFKTLEIPDLSGNGDLNNISGSEYWNLSNTGTASDADVTLFWKDQARSEIDNAADLQIAHYNGTHWENLGQSSINFSDPGSITVTGVSSFSPLTFGSESSSSNPLPVELTSLEAFVTSNSVIIKWSTASEVNNDHFVIERSHDGLEFKKIGTIQGNGSTTELNKYQFEDHSPIIGSSYYRLKQVDFDGKSQDSNLLSVNFDQLKYSIFPNPITNGELNLQIVSGATGYGYLTLINALGQTAMTEEYAFEPMTYQNLHIGVNKLPKGIYILKMQIDNKILKERVIIK